MFIRVRNKNTGHQYDIDERTLAQRPGVEPLDDERWPPSDRPRPALAKRALGGPHPKTAKRARKRAAKKTTAKAAAQQPEVTTEQPTEPGETA